MICRVANRIGALGDLPAVTSRMSAFGTKRTSLVALLMSASGGKADMAIALHMSANDPKRTSVIPRERNLGIGREGESYT